MIEWFQHWGGVPEVKLIEQDDQFKPIWYFEQFQTEAAKEELSIYVDCNNLQPLPPDRMGG